MSGADNGKGAPYGLIAVAVVVVIALVAAGFLIFSGDDEESGAQDPVPLTELSDNPGILALRLQGIWQEAFDEESRTYEDVAIQPFEEAEDAPTVCRQDAENEVAFYCVENTTLYIDGPFFEEVKKEGGPLGAAYVVAHLMGHHVQQVLGIRDRAISQQQADQAKVPLVRRQLELEADCLAGFSIAALVSDSVSEDEVEQAIQAAADAAESRVQETQSNPNAETWQNGPVADQVEWVTKGLGVEDVGACDTFGGQVTTVPPR